MKLLLIFLSLLSTSALNIKTASILNKQKLPIIREPTEPLNNFNIFNSDNIPISFIRESELKHSRIAMIVAVVFPIMEQFSNNLAINQFQELTTLQQYSLISLMTISEFTSMQYGWVNPSFKIFSLKDDYQPGDLGFNIWNPDDPNIGSLMDKELNNGRLAMIGIFGMMVQELVTQQQLF